MDGSLWTQILDKRGVSYQPLLVSEVIALLCGIKISAVHWFGCHKTHVWQTDRQTDGQNYDLHDRASIAASRSKKLEGDSIITYSLLELHDKLNLATGATHVELVADCWTLFDV